MPTVLQAIKKLIDKVSVTDRQEESIKTSTDYLNGHLTKDENDLDIDSTFVNGSYERDTIIRPLDDVDLFAILNESEWSDEYGNLPKPQAVLTKIKNKLNSISHYKDKVTQDRPCVTVTLNSINFDVLPSFERNNGGYLIPNYDLESWTYSYPKQLTDNLNDCNRNNGYKIKDVVKAIKYWNRENKKLIPSFQIEETLITYFNVHNFGNYEEAIRLWFNNAEYYLEQAKFKTNNQYDDAIKKIKKVKDKLNTAKEHLDENENAEALQIWKGVFGKEFIISDVDEAKSFSQKLSDGLLKSSSTGAVSESVGRNIPASKGFYGDI
jgi:tRNA nucleotidyltransferase (CCA-adding enzyme)